MSIRSSGATLWANLYAIYCRELQQYFGAPLAYGVAGIFWLLGGFFFFTVLLAPGGLISAIAAQDQAGGGGQSIDVAYEFLKLYLGLLGSLSMFILPILSMGLYAEERKQGTLELLATSPVTNWVVALGKLLAILSLYVAIVLPLMLLEAIALSAADPPIQLGVLLLGHLGLVLMAASILSLGMFISSLTSSTVLAAIMTFALMLVLWVMDVIAQAVGGPLGDALGHLSVLRHFSTLTEGIFDTSGLVMFSSYIGLGIFLTAQSIETLRFQRS